MHNKLILASMVSLALTGCGGDTVIGTAPSNNQPPFVPSIPNLTVAPGQDFTFEISAEDDQVLTYALEGNPEWITIDASTGVVSVDADASVVGDYTFMVVVSDGELQSSQLITLKVSNDLPETGNSAPIFSDIPQLTARTHYPLNYYVKASDAEGDFVSYSLAEQPAWVTIDPETGLLTVAAKSGHEGDYRFLVKAHDGQKESSTTILLVVEYAEAPVTPPSNQIPNVLNIPTQFAKSDHEFSLRVAANDLDGDILTFALQDSPNWIAINPETGLITATPSAEQVGEHTINVVVTDGKVDVVKSFALNVALSMTPVDPDAVQTAPFVYDIPTLNVKSNHQLAYRVKASDKNQDALTFELKSQPHWVKINPLSGLITAMPLDGHVGRHNFTVEVTDGVFVVSKPVQLEVELAEVEDNRTAPVVEAIPELSVKANQPLNYRVKATDADGDTLSYSIAEQPGWIGIDPLLGLIVAEPQPSHVGRHVFTLTVTDGVFDQVQSFTVDVAQADAPDLPNLAPVIDEIDDISANAGQLTTYRVKASDEDGDVLTYSVESSRSWISIDARTGLLSFRPEVGHEGRYRVAVNVDDGKETSSKSFILEVVSAPISNVAPVIETIPAIEAAAGQQTTYRVKASDADGDALSFSLESAPAWITIDDIGLLSLVPTEDVLGEHTFTVVVSDGYLTTKQTVTTLVETVTEPDGPDILPMVYNATLTASGKRISGQVLCNGEPLTLGSFKVTEEESTTCHLGHVELGSFEPKPYPDLSPSRPLESDMAFELSSIHGVNVTRVLQAINGCETTDELCLEEINAYDIEGIFQQLDDTTAVNAFLQALEEMETDDINKSPTSHVNTDIVPAVSGGSNDLNSPFVSSVAEDLLVYKPSVESKVMTQAVLTDVNNIPLMGVEFYSNNARGVTDENGHFEYLWGDEVSFGIDTFEFGSIKGNRIDFKLADVTSNKIKQDNIQAFVERYATNRTSHFEFAPLVKKTFEIYPNVINEIISLDLPNGGRLEGTDFALPNEFEAQFEQGEASEIDAVLKQHTTGFTRAINLYRAAGDTAYVTDSLNRLFSDVENFHVFHDGYTWYSSVGPARAMRTLNLSNSAFPIMMPRNDRNGQLPFGQPQKWTRDGKPFVVSHPGVTMPPVPLVSSDSVTYNLPFVASGEIGRGKVISMGNIYYLDILACPNTFWSTHSNEMSVDSTTKTCTTKASTSDKRYDNGDMKRFFKNTFEWLGVTSANIATNVDRAYHFLGTKPTGLNYPFFVSDEYGFGEMRFIEKGGFGSLSAKETPLVILRGYEPTRIEQTMSHVLTADLSKPLLTVEDVSALINYVNDGGNVLLIDTILGNNPEPIGRLVDAAGIALGNQNVAPVYQNYCGTSYYCRPPTPNVHVQYSSDVVILERINMLENGDLPYTVSADGHVTWSKDTPVMHIPTFEDENGTTHYAKMNVSGEEEKQAAITKLQAAFPGTPVCSNDYQYEFNCIEFRQGHGRNERGPYGRTDFDRYNVDVASMVKAANLGQNITKLAEHELYYRSRGHQGKRLSQTDLHQTYDNMSVWMWNDNQYRYDSTIQDELGFETLVNYLNCYTSNQHGGGTSCPEDLKAKLVSNGMIYGDEHGELAGQMNPSYPLNFEEKPLTRIMLGRSFWDHDIKVDTTSYPGRVTESGTNATVSIMTGGRKVTMSAGNMQSTGLWAKQHEEITVTGGVAASISVMLADNLTGRPQHELSLKRPPRMQTSFDHDGTSTTFSVPYGGLIYIQPRGTAEDNVANFTFNNVVKAAFYKDGTWITTPQETSVKIAEVDTGHVVYTTPVANVTAQDMSQFVADMNRFANATSDFYGRDETSSEGLHRRFTYDDLPGYRHRFVNDVQISVGAAHSGYPVMSSTYSPTATTIPTQPKNNWLLWHEIGHNLAAAPFSAQGSTEVTNNLLALYMQELDGRNENPRMDRIIFDIKKAPTWLNAYAGHAWSEGNAGIRLVMFGQLKIWAETHFDIDDWYADGEQKPSIYNHDQGWNLFKLMHRKARGDTQGDTGINYCDSRDVGLNEGDQMMLCASYLTGYDLSEFFTTWNVGESSVVNPQGEVEYSGGISPQALSVLAELELPEPEINPLSISSLPH
ncbi:SslE/AcfD family lipoprotein zinc metalloprotease [Vibrio alfacsensis]|uniref:SslE/AcfD family lipoprotein zinc metalloprotease n=1 Tax=Vibrio alfacsensis TaxID=1074311 RepID=UPI001BF17B47|nr:SslE/AcfD family lipoprotein zinc metalloprotease [Vibrio alfacsensis]BCN24301.1 hypothetical protein VYA_14930 [Vibrio alfacsensis]